MDYRGLDLIVANLGHLQRAGELPVGRIKLQDQDIVGPRDEDAASELALGGFPLSPDFPGGKILDAGIIGNVAAGRLVDLDKKGRMKRVGPDDLAAPALLPVQCALRPRPRSNRAVIRESVTALYLLFAWVFRIASISSMAWFITIMVLSNGAELVISTPAFFKRSIG